jgi:uncharacterized integral membrane protein
MFRLIGFILLFGILIVFIGSNLENNCNVSFGPLSLEAVPVYLTAFCAFIVGLLCSVPFVFSLRVKRNRALGKLKAGDGLAPEKGGALKKGGWNKKAPAPPEAPTGEAEREP